MLKIFWFGYGGHSWMAEALRPLINELDMELITIHEHENANIKWERTTYLNELKMADIIILPCNYKEQPAKSNNKLTQALSLGKPVVCSPLPAYLKIIKENPNLPVLVAYNTEDWKKHLIWIRDNYKPEWSEFAKETIQNYSIDAIGQQWIKQFNNLDKTDIIIPTRNNLKCLQLCLESIRRCTENYNIIVVDNGSTDGTKEYCERLSLKYVRKEERLSFSKAINLGISVSNSKYICLLNDDVIVSKNWLKYLTNSLKDNVGIVGPLSNCDFGWRHKHHITIHNAKVSTLPIELLPGVNTFGQIEPIFEDIMSYSSTISDESECNWVAFYCVVFKKELVTKIGSLDEQFVNSGEDVDFCYRASKMGYKIIQNYNSFVFHFGAAGRKVLENENKEVYQEEQKNTNIYLNEKWNKETVILYSGPAWEPWSFKSLETGIGGSEIHQIWLSRELSKLGYRVISFADTREQELRDNNIIWLPFTDYNKWVEQNYADYVILERTTDPLRLPLRAKKVYAQLHDIWLLSQREQLFLDKVTKFCALSEWHSNFASDYHKIPKDKMEIMANGIDFNRFDSVKVERNPYRFHWSSSWDRGLDNVLYLWPFIKKELPKAELHAFYGVFNWRSACEQRGDKEGLKKIAELEELVKQDGVFTYGRVSQKQLAEEICKASVLFYPSSFSETFFITGIECQYAGVPVICNKYAGVTTTFGNSAIMLGNGDAYWPYSKEGREAFFTEVVSLLKDKEKWQKWSDLGRENAKKYSWSNVALMWNKLFKL